MKKLLLALALLLLSAPAQAVVKPEIFTSELAVRAGDVKLMLVAPPGMCFLDNTGSALQRKIYATLAAPQLAEKGQVLLAVFIDCNNISDPASWFDGTPAYGTIAWMNPAIGDVAKTSRQDYLDMREASFIPYVKGRMPGFTPAQKLHRNAENVSVAMTGMEGVPGLQHKAVTAGVSTTLLRQVPLEIFLHTAGDDTDKAYAGTDGMVAHLSALNP